MSDDGSTTAGAADDAIRYGREVKRLQKELTQAYTYRDALGVRIDGALNSILWRWYCKPLFWLARARGRLRVPKHALTVLADAGWTGNAWHGHGLPELLLPLPLPVEGWVRVRAVINSSLGTRAVLYFDTGRAFSQHERVELGAVSGETMIDRMIYLKRPTYSVRFDPIQAPGVCDVTDFSFDPQSVFTFYRRGLVSAAKKGSAWADLKLVLAGKMDGFRKRMIDHVEAPQIEADYERFRLRRGMTEGDRRRIGEHLNQWTDPPLISVVLPVYNVDEPYLRRCIESVRSQLYPRWELCIADDASPAKHVRKVLESYKDDPRIKVVYRQTTGNISAASNSALELATGPYTALLDHDDELTEHALYAVAAMVVSDPDLDFIYSDEDKITPEGRCFEPFFKPDWSPEYLLSNMYVAHLAVYRTDLIRKIGGWRSQFDGAQDYDLALRMMATNPKVAHVADVLYHWRAIPNSTAVDQALKPEAAKRGMKAVETYLTESGRGGRVEPGPSGGYYKVRFDLPQPLPKISLVIPTAGKRIQVRGKDTWFIVECVHSVRKWTTYENLEIVVVDNEDLEPEVVELLKPLGVQLMSYTEPFNLASKINQGVDAATGEYVVLLNDDIEVITADWIEGMLEYCQWPEIGAVGVQLLFPDDRLQHAGVVLLDGNPGHAFYGFPGDHPGHFHSSQVTRNWSAVTGACLMTRKDLYQSVGGFTERLPLNYNDVDYCLKLGKLGKRIAYVPHVRMYHHESVSKPATPITEVDAFKYMWGDAIRRDPFYNPNLTMHAYDFALG